MCTTICIYVYLRERGGGGRESNLVIYSSAQDEKEKKFMERG